MDFYRKLILLLLMIFLIGPLFIYARPPLTTLSTDSDEGDSHARISVSITDAYYTDLDGDGYEDDVFGLITIELEGATTYTFDYYITLYLPSGLSFSYLYVITTNYVTLELQNNFFDHAIESGWYTLDIMVNLHTGGEHIDKDSYDFDPPGGTCCSDPTFTLQ